MKPTNYQSDCSKPIVNGGNTNSVYIKNVNNLIETDKKQPKVIRERERKRQTDRQRQTEIETKTERQRQRDRETERESTFKSICLLFNK